MCILPFAKCCRRLDSDSFFTFKIHRVHLCSYSVFSSNIVNRADLPRIEQNSFGQRRLATINVCRNTDVSDARTFIVAEETCGMTKFTNRPGNSRQPRLKRSCEGQQRCHGGINQLLLHFVTKMKVVAEGEKERLSSSFIDRFRASSLAYVRQTLYN